MRGIGALLSLLILGAAQAPDWTPAATAVEDLLREVLPDALGRGLDGHRRLGDGPVLVLNEIAEDRVHLSPRALPAASAPEFKLFTRAEARAQAAATGRSAWFIAIFTVELGPDTATVTLGGDLVVQGPKLCCCVERLRYRRTSGRWAFLDQRNVICA